ncbi:MAG: hypothetical protein ACXAE3_09220 [Candidatus Kariarchaeaceae archaeon]
MTSPYDLPHDRDLIDDLLNSPLHPVMISFLNTGGSQTATPVWTHFNPDDSCFYLFSYKKSMKVRTIEAGNSEFTLTLINRGSYPVVKADELPYLSMTGTMELVDDTSVDNIHELHIKLLEKYNSADQEIWVGELIEKLRGKPEGTWMLRFTPGRLRFYK